jgi:integrase
MASISTTKGTNNRRIRFVGADRKAHTIHLGKMARKTAEEVKCRVEAIVTATVHKVSVDRETAAWLATIEDKLYRKLVGVGLVSSRAAAERIKLGSLIDSYIQLRTDLKPNTTAHLQRARRNLVEFFGDQKYVDEITPADADEFRLHLAETMDADSTVPRICGRAKQFFRYAVRKKLLAENPFGDMKSLAVKANKDREFFVTPEIASRVLDACPDNEWRLLFALCRFGGLRCPSEPLALRWGDVDWERSRIRVSSPKTEHHDGKDHRWIPIFPELRPYLDAAWDAAKPKAEFVITRYRNANANLRTQFNRIVRKAGLEPWQKPFQNLRSTRETELSESYPMHVVCAWIGNSESVAKKHYLQVTDGHFEKATQNPTLSTAIRSNLELSGETVGPAKDRENANFPVLATTASSPGRTRTYDKPVNSRLLYQLSYRGV